MPGDHSIPPEHRWKVKTTGIVSLALVAASTLSAGAIGALDSLAVTGVVSACVSGILVLVRGRVDSASLVPALLGPSSAFAVAVAGAV